MALSPLSATENIGKDKDITLLRQGSEGPTIQQLINALDYIKHENKELEAIYPELHEQALMALDESYPFKAIDVLINALKYIAQRFEAFQDKFDIHMLTGHLELDKPILDALPLDLTLTVPTPANDEQFKFIDYGESL